LSIAGAHVMIPMKARATATFIWLLSMDSTCPELSIIVPTYRECENLRLLLPNLYSVVAGSQLDAEVIVVDDNSRDGTVELCDDLASTHPLRLICRTNEKGLSSAVLAGMRASRGGTILVMDADHSHPVQMIPKIFAAIQAGNDMVIGSRYVEGGSTDYSWGVFRWLNSTVATLMARPLTRVRDPMSGFFAITRQKFQSAAPLNPLGYKIGLELLIKCRCEKVVEMPIHFSNRRHGTSKLSIHQQLEYLLHLTYLYAFKIRHSRVEHPAEG
jgi:dolichol-phosphate mannosyltransferase